MAIDPNSRQAWESLLATEYGQELFEGIYTIFQSPPNRDQDFDDIRDFILYGNIPGYDSLGFRGSLLFEYSENDFMSVLMTDACISSLIAGTSTYDPDYVVEEYINFLRETQFGYENLTDNSDKTLVRGHFWGLTGNEAVITYSSSEEYEPKYNSALSTFQYFFSIRLNYLYDFILEYGTDLPTDYLDQLEDLESAWSTEEDARREEEVTSTEALEVIADIIYGTRGGGINDVLNDAFKLRNRSSDNINSFYRIFTTELADVSELSDRNLEVIYSKLLDTGLLELASYAFEISNFAKKRLASKSSLISNANNLVDPAVDLPWMMILMEVKQRLQADTIFFANVHYYFPGLTAFFLDALSIIVDYSNDGRGGGFQEENEEMFLETLKEAFGNGQQEIMLANEFSNTQKRIDEVLARSPFRKNVQPDNPDIFHLRLGAANFYVPPVSIDVNTRFKTGSMVGGALRQKNSPKFNSGYRETTVSMRLFFPNYLEIWGIDIGATGSINLNDNFEINFSYNEDENNQQSLGDSDKKIDKFLSSLRGLVAAFKYSPILPVKNHYLNSVHGITGVALSSMSISTVPGFPFALAVDIELLNFNHKPFLPMIKDFNQSIHWGKYRQYMGKAATSLHKYVNESFLLKTSDTKEEDTSDVNIIDLGQDSAMPATTGLSESTESNSIFGNDTLVTNILDEWRDGNHLTLYAPAEVQTKLFLPDTSSFRSEQEEYLTDQGEATWEQILKTFGIDITNVSEFSQYGTTLSDVVNLSRNNEYKKSTYNLVIDSIDLLLSTRVDGTNKEKSYLFLIEDFIIQNSNSLDDNRKDWLREYSETEAGLNLSQYSDVGTYRFGSNVLRKRIPNAQGDDRYQNLNLSEVKRFFFNITNSTGGYLSYIEDQVRYDIEYRTGQTPDEEQVQEEVRRAFNVSLYERFFKSGTIQSLMEAARAKAGNFRFNEWEVPMIRVDLDPNSVIIDGFYVTLANNFAKMQIQMQDEPSYQHIGGMDSYIDIKMTIIGEKELIKLKKIFDHITALARLEHATGVIGFLGIKNIVTALAGIKYVMPLNYSVSTKPSYPHVYDVSLRLVDFDIFQQKREQLSSLQQKDLVENFGTKKNPFLRIKQMWGSFNAYPDFPLQIRDGEDTVGHLDPDFYFRSFEMFDDDVVNNISTEMPKVQSFIFQEPETAQGQIDLSIRVGRVSQKIKDIIQEYNGSNISQMAEDIAEYVLDEGLSKELVQRAFKQVMGWDDQYLGIDGFDYNRKWDLLTSFINYRSDEDSELNPFFEEIVPGSYFSVGNLGPSDYSMSQELEAALSGALSLPGEQYVSFHPDEVDFHKIISAVPAMSPEDIVNNRVSSILITAIGNYFGYLDRSNGRFYLTNGGGNVLVDGEYRTTLRPNPTVDVGTPDTGIAKTDPPFTGIGKSIATYQNAYEGDEYKHWEKMLVDTKYRDISGRMIRAFPTYMLWLIDEGGHFAGMKLFDNFYGLQSIIDFSVVSSEDLLGDTLIFRVSNMYSKLTTNESSKIFNVNVDDYNNDSLDLTQGLAAIVDRTLNMSRNILGHMRNEYVVDINNIRLKPGVRVHLRGGYGSNPNSLQTLFNGTITNVEQGEIVTVTAQSDAIELGAMVNSTNKKGDTGKIDGGIDTGFWMSEPRDLMVRLLSMGSSRAREAIANSYNGTIFSENRFGIRHFGTTLYDALTEQEGLMAQGKMDKLAAAFTAAGNGSVGSAALSFSNYTFDLVNRIFANNANDIDIEIFKRNIYPGNGTGIAQFLGGDIDDGWSTVSSLKEEDMNERSSRDLGTLTDIAWNRLLSQSNNNSNYSANRTVESLTEDNELYSSGRSQAISNILGIGSTALAGGVGFMIGGPVGAGIAGSLSGIMTGRGGQSLWRTMGIISANPDDDLPGFDEVSFRAQTYMRTVWDMFQTCARLLPNYIVAVRPFEDRSTIFYGKPHWLYTSGVVPVTTGYTAQNAPRSRSADADLVKILDELNTSTNPLADYAAYFESSEINSQYSELQNRLINPQGTEFAPTTQLSGKLINFLDTNSSIYKDPLNDGKILCKLPSVVGGVDVGFHLPITSEGKNTSAAVKDIPHKQISNLPPRYSWPFFVDSRDIKLTSGTSYTYAENDDEIFKNKFKDLRDIEKQYLEETEQTLIASGDAINLDKPLAYDDLFEYEGVQRYIQGKQDTIVTMPNPGEQGLLASETDLLEMSDPVYSNIFSEWGSPATAEDEQFYIAMRWPYDLSLSNPEITQNIIDYHYGKYIAPVITNPDEAGRTDTGRNSRNENSPYHNDAEYADPQTLVYGTPQDYKNRKVLVYNPNNKRAVVCRPAYFLWNDGDIEVSGQRNRGVSEISRDAVVSPDAAYYLGIITETDSSATVTQAAGGSNGPEYDEDGRGFRQAPQVQECYFSFVPDNVPVGVIADQIAPANIFDIEGTSNEFVIGFGNFQSRDNNTLTAIARPSNYFGVIQGYWNNYLNWYAPDGGEQISMVELLPYGGNVLFTDRTSGSANQTDSTTSASGGYFDVVLNSQFDLISNDNLKAIAESENPEGSRFRTIGRVSFAPVYTEIDQTSIEARQFYDETFDANVSVIAGDGRTLLEAQDIWDQFRYGYHTYTSVKQIFTEVYGMDPDDETELPPTLQRIINGSSSEVFKKFSDTSLDEFAVILGEDWINNGNGSSSQSSSQSSAEDREEALEFIRTSFVDAPSSEGGLIETLNNFLVKRLSRVRENFFESDDVNTILGFSLSSEYTNAEGVSIDVRTEAKDIVRQNITTPKQLFLLMVGLFRQRMWEDPYARAWLVLRPDRKLAGSDNWSFRPVDRIFRAYIDPYNDYAKKKDKFKQLLVATRAEGNSSSNVFSYVANGIGDFFSKNVSPIWGALSNGLSGLLNMYKLSMQQMGYAMSEAADFRKQAHILNKAFNDSIYYSLGREGSLLRACDNPFTREYGEPVLEIREPFQRIHYISSFSHIISNQIQENLNGVATTVTAVSDGKYPVTVALDKGAPAERQVEKTIETGIYFDNMVGSGFFGFLHPLMHPLETFRGVSKNISGSPDELSARRIALSHLKESIKDVYQGELVVIGNADIRPHDLVYLSDVYERMYGIFEVEQVVHHFTSDMGFVTSITPNALVTVNDPSRWYLTSWIHSWMNTQTIRNDARIYLDSIRDGNNSVIVGGAVSVDRLSEILAPQITGGLQFTHGSSALVKDAIALETAKNLPNSTEAIIAQTQANTSGAGAAAVGTAAFSVIAGGLAALAAPVTGGAATLAAAAIGSNLGGQLAWGGWKWVRDNLLDQHGCYVQYLNRNGQPMDAGLSYNQGMVVGEYHSKALLPGILGVRNKVRTPEGYAYIRTDDLFKSLGWKETEISSLTRYIGLENALVHSRILQLGGLGPERADLEPQFKVIVKVNRFVDGDTLDVSDVLNPENTFTIRFNGINTSETNVMSGKVLLSDAESNQLPATITALDMTTPGGAAKMYVKKALENKVFVLRINKSRSVSIVGDDLNSYFEPGSDVNQRDSYTQDTFNRTLATIFYYMPETFVSSAKSRVESILRSAIGRGDVDSFRSAVKDSMGDVISAENSPVFYNKFEQIYDSINADLEEVYFDYTNVNDPIVSETTTEDRRVFDVLVYMLALESVYATASQWPSTAWDEYYGDGYPVTLNWELVVNNLAKVYVADLQKESQSVIDANESAALPTAVNPRNAM